MVVLPKHPKMILLVGKPMVAGETHHFRKPPYNDPHGFEELLQWSLVGHKNTSVAIGSQKSWTLCPTPPSDPMHHKGILGCFKTVERNWWFFCSEVFGRFFCGEMVQEVVCFFWKSLDETREFLDETSISIKDLLWYGELSGPIGMVCDVFRFAVGLYLQLFHIPSPEKPLDIPAVPASLSRAQFGKWPCRLEKTCWLNGYCKTIGDGLKWLLFCNVHPDPWGWWSNLNHIFVRWVGSNGNQEMASHL